MVSIMKYTSLQLAVWKLEAEARGETLEEYMKPLLDLEEEKEAKINQKKDEQEMRSKRGGNEKVWQVAERLAKLRELDKKDKSWLGADGHVIEDLNGYRVKNNDGLRKLIRGEGSHVCSHCQRRQAKSGDTFCSQLCKTNAVDKKLRTNQIDEEFDDVVIKKKMEEDVVRDKNGKPLNMNNWLSQYPTFDEVAYPGLKRN